MALSIEHIKRLSVSDYPIALNSYQFKLLGMNWPPKHGWIGRLIGSEIPRELYNVLCELRGKSKKERKSVLKSHGLTAHRLFCKRGTHFTITSPKADYCI